MADITEYDRQSFTFPHRISNPMTPSIRDIAAVVFAAVPEQRKVIMVHHDGFESRDLTIRTPGHEMCAGEKSLIEEYRVVGVRFLYES